jgi:hypothetical protein
VNEYNTSASQALARHIFHVHAGEVAVAATLAAAVVHYAGDDRFHYACLYDSFALRGSTNGKPARYTERIT